MTYYECMEVMNTLMSEDIWEPVELSYMSINKDVEEGKLVSEATDNSLQGKTSHVTNEVPALNNTPKPWGEGVVNVSTNMCSSQEVINIQLPYDVNQVTEQDSWDGNFHPISLHSTLKHPLSDSKNIKEPLRCITKYIKNKDIEPNKANNVLDLKGIGEAAWNFISALYESSWDVLIADKGNWSFRQRVTLRFTLKIQEIRKKSDNNNKTDKPVSFVKLSPLILAKML